MRRMLFISALVAVLLIVTATFASAHESTPADATGPGYCLVCHPSAHPDQWPKRHGMFRSSEPQEYGACGTCHDDAFCVGCHKSGY